MIIGISGKIGSGKDTVGKIIQYLWIIENRHTLKLLNLNPFESLVERGFDFNKYSTGQIKKFAYKLKQFISLVTGIPVEDLEKEEVKYSLLSKEWMYGWHYTIENKMERCDLNDYHLTSALPYPYQVENNITVRQLLQEIGTEVCRQVHPNFWVNALFSEYKCIGNVYEPRWSNTGFPNWIITDMRYPNEKKAVEDREGITIRVNRNQLCKCGRYKHEHTSLENHSFVEESKNNHTSETALDNATFDHTIDNSGSIEDLIQIVKEILIQHQII